MRTDTAATAEGLRRMLRQVTDALPFEARAAVGDRFVEVVVEFLDHDRVDPLLGFVRSCAVTARPYQNPAYMQALAEADAKHRRRDVVRPPLWHQDVARADQVIVELRPGFVVVARFYGPGGRSRGLVLRACRARDEASASRAK